MVSLIISPCSGRLPKQQPSWRFPLRPGATWFNRATSHVHEQIVFLYLKRLSEWHRRNRSIAARNADLYRSSLIPLLWCRVLFQRGLHRITEQGLNGMEAGNTYLVWKDTRTNTESERVRERHRWLFFLWGTRLRLTGLPFSFYPLLYLSSLHLFVHSGFLALTNLSIQNCLVITFLLLALSFTLSLSFLCQLTVWNDSKAVGSRFSLAPSSSWSSALWGLRAFKGVCPCM